MKIVHISYPSITDFPVSGQALAIGYFDGVHLGHQEVIRRTLHIAREQMIPASIMTFHPHPKEVLGQLSNAQYLTPLEEKINLFASMGVDTCYIVTFDRTFSQVSPERFVTQMLFAMHSKAVVVGFNFTFGYLGKGTAETLMQLSQGKMRVEVIPPYHLDGHKVSSTFIKELLQAGKIEQVNQLLGRNYSINGKVVHGEGRGRTIGFPTANIEISSPYIIPGNGVYAVQLTMEGSVFQGVMNIGVKPTFSGGEMKTTMETHIIQFEQDIYGKQLHIEFISFLRPENKFASVDLLIQQIHKDIDQAKALMQCKSI